MDTTRIFDEKRRERVRRLVEGIDKMLEAISLREEALVGLSIEGAKAWLGLAKELRAWAKVAQNLGRGRRGRDLEELLAGK